MQATGSAKALLSTSLVAGSPAEFDGIPGMIPGTAVEVLSEEEITQGTLQLHFDPSSVNPEEELAIVHFDEQDHTWDFPENQIIDITKGIASVTTSEFSPFILVRVKDFTAIWSKELVLPREPGNSNSQNVDIVLSIDGSGSMSWNDPSNLRFEAAGKFIDELLIADQVAVLGFDLSANLVQSLTTDHTLAKSKIPYTYTYGGTSISAAIRGALDELATNGNASHNKHIVLLTDGEGDYDHSLTDRAIAEKTSIYTVGLGSSIDSSLLEDIASKTGGEFYWVASASELPTTFNRITKDVGEPDTDGDGLADRMEIEGWYSWRGKQYTSDPLKADTDGDGLSDGQEALLTIEQKVGFLSIYIIVVSDPNKPDTDGDGLDDLTEVTEGTNPLKADSDYDGLNDFDEIIYGSDPNRSNPDADRWKDNKEFENNTDPFHYDLTKWEHSQALTAGAIFGEWTWGARNIGRLNSAQLESISYLTGQLASGFIVFGDIRDAAASIVNGDLNGTLLSLAGLIPIAGDGGKTAAKLADFALHSPAAARSALKFSIKTAKNNDEQVKIIKKAVTKNPKQYRLPQDAAVQGKDAPRLLKLDRPISRSVKQNQAKDKIIEELRKSGFTDFRVNQQQLKAGETRVGINRPDIQATSQGGKRIHIELDTASSKRGPDHATRIFANDPDSEVFLLTEDNGYFLDLNKLPK